MTQKQFNDLRDKLKELQEREGRRGAQRQAARRKGRRSVGTNVVWTAADEKMVADIREKLVLLRPRRNQNPAIAETVTLARHAGHER